MSALVPRAQIEQTIFLIRGHRVMLDADLAKLYGVTTFNLNKALKRNSDRFPEDFMFRLSAQETATLTFQIGISKPRGRGGRRSLRDRRKKQGLSQVQLAERLQSSQSRVAKMEAGDPTVSMDLLVSSLLQLGASSTDLANAIRGGEKRKGPHAA